jgi:uroporphyrinogen decarboxylase
MNETPLFLRACRREPTERTPVWLMRQAGRYLPEYKAVRAKVDFLTLCRTPELACEVTLQPLRRFPFDAAILFSDLLVPLEAMGATVTFPEEGGPAIADGIKTPADVDRLRTPPAAEALPYVAESVKLLCAELKVPLIGFAGAPFTLASYLIEGGTSRNFTKTKKFLYQHPEAAERLFDKLATMVADLLNLQAASGCRALQIFDSWAGALDPDDYARWGEPWTRRIVDAVRRPGLPVIVFAKGTGTYLEKPAATGADVLGIDWTLALDRARALVGDGVALQGNLDPVRLLGPWEPLREAIDRILAVGGDGHVFNLGHGILPETPIDNVSRLVDHVHHRSAR